MSEKYKKTNMHLNHAEQVTISASKITGCVSISSFASLFFVLVEITSSAKKLKIFSITAGIKKCKSIIKKKKKKHNEIL